MSKHKSKYSQRSGFNVPKDYFESLEERILHNFDESSLSNVDTKNSGFKVPEGYFDGLEEKIFANQSNNKPKLISLVKKEYLFYAAAVAAIFVMMLGDVFKTESVQSFGWDDVEVSALESYINEGYDMGYFEMNTSDFSDIIFPGNNLIYEEDFEAVDSDAVLEYLDENIEDPTYILD
jgi:hypothetical protein